MKNEFGRMRYNSSHIMNYRVGLNFNIDDITANETGMRINYAKFILINGILGLLKTRFEKVNVWMQIRYACIQNSKTIVERLSPRLK